MEPMHKFFYDLGKEIPNVVFLGEEGISQHRFRFVPGSPSRGMRLAWRIRRILVSFSTLFSLREAKGHI
jgi:hypothetical protein